MLTRNEIKTELLLNPEYSRIANLDYAPDAVEMYVSLFAAYKFSFGEESTVQQWEQYQADYSKRERYEALRELICKIDIAKAGK